MHTPIRNNNIKRRLVKGIDPCKIKEGQSVVFGGKLYFKRNGGLRNATHEETVEFIKEHTQKTEQQQ